MSMADEIVNTEESMNESEAALIASGFPQEQWPALKSFILASIANGHWRVEYAKVLQAESTVK